MSIIDKLDSEKAVVLCNKIQEASDEYIATGIDWGHLYNTPFTKAIKHFNSVYDFDQWISSEWAIGDLHSLVAFMLCGSDDALSVYFTYVIDKVEECDTFSALTKNPNEFAETQNITGMAKEVAIAWLQSESCYGDLCTTLQECQELVNDTEYCSISFC